MMAKRVLFVCTHNSARSQMAEAFLNDLGKGRFEAESAGLEPRGINPYVIEAMQELGYDLKAKKSDSVFEFFKEGRLYSYVIYVCEKETEEKCPVFPGIQNRQHWPFPDPSSFTGTPEEILARVRLVRDAIRARIEDFIEKEAES